MDCKKQFCNTIIFILKHSNLLLKVFMAVIWYHVEVSITTTQQTKIIFICLNEIIQFTISQKGIKHVFLLPFEDHGCVNW